MEHANRRYSEEEVSRIIRHALSRSGPHDTISHEELVDIANASGISAGRLESAIEYLETEGAVDDAKEEWLRRHRGEFYNHLTSYCIVNGFLILVYLLTTRGGYFWPIWPMMGWGIGLAFHFVNTFFVSDRQIERGARRLLRNKRKNRAMKDEIKWADES